MYFKRLWEPHPILFGAGYHMATLGAKIATRSAPARTASAQPIHPHLPRAGAREGIGVGAPALAVSQRPGGLIGCQGGVPHRVGSRRVGGSPARDVVEVIKFVDANAGGIGRSACG